MKGAMDTMRTTRMRRGASLMLGLALLTSLVGATAGASEQRAAKCFGQEPTIRGTWRSETINGTSGNDVILAGPGDDTINGLEGDDLICGGPGDDTISGGPGNDKIKGQGGDDVLSGNDGDDMIVGGGGGDTLSGTPGIDTDRAGAGIDQCNSADDTFVSCESFFGEDELDPSLTASVATTSLTAGFTPDPWTRSVTSGGPVDVAAFLGHPATSFETCRGFASAAPDFQLTWNGTSSLLRFYMIANGDTTLIINDPNGNWACVDDWGSNRNPSIDYNNPPQGVYDIWVASFSQGTAHTGTFHVTDRGACTPGTPCVLDPGLTAEVATTSLTAGFTPDPWTRSVTSGGPVDVAAFLGHPATSFETCRGFASAAPDFQLTWNGTSSLLRFYMIANGDTTLIINDPNGNWACVDDWGSNRNPSIDYNNPPQGVYDIWVASFSQGTAHTGTFHVTERGACTPGSSC